MLDSPKSRRIRPSLLPYVMAVLAFSSAASIVLTDKPVWAATPVITAPATATGTEGSPIATLTASATDADATNTLTITRSGEPASLTFTPSAPGVSPRTARITGTLAPGDAAGSPYNIVWTVDDGTGGSASTTTVLTVLSGTNQGPIANTGGPYQPVCPNVDVCFDGSGSHDPDLGQILTYSWDFGDGTVGTGPNICHAFQRCGGYNVCLTVTDNGSPPLSNTACTTQQIEPPQLKVSRKSSGVVNLKAASPKDQEITATLITCLSSTGGISSWKMRFGASETAPDAQKIVGASTTLTFSNTTLTSLFSSLSAGKTTDVTVTIEGVTTTSQCVVSGDLTFSVQK